MYTDCEGVDPKDLLKELVCHVVDRPEDVHIDAHVTEHSATFDIHVNDGDLGMAIGKRGELAESLRRIFRAIYGKLGKRVYLQVVDPRR